MTDRVPFLELLRNTPTVLYRLAAKRLPNQTQWQLHTLIADIFPASWLGTEDPETERFPESEYDFVPKSLILGKYAFITAQISGNTLATWLSQEEEFSLDDVYPNETSKQFKLIIPPWVRQEGNLNSTEYYTWQPDRSPALPFPHTSFMIYGTTDPNDIQEENKPLAGAGYHYRTFPVALREQIYEVSDREMSRSFQPSPLIQVRTVHGEAYLHKFKINEEEINIEVRGLGLSDCRLNVSHSKGTIKDFPLVPPRLYTIPIHEELSFPLIMAIYNSNGDTLDIHEYRPNIIPTYAYAINQLQEINLPNLAKVSEQQNSEITFPYDVAFSFAGEQRIIADKLAKIVKDAGYTVYLDSDNIVASWGKYLPDYLAPIYRNESRFCIMLISNAYVNKIWPNFERQNILTRAIRDKGKDYILPVKIEDVEVPGLPPDLVYVPTDKYSIEDIGEMLVKKLQS